MQNNDEPLVKLALFRRKNGLFQQEIADYLNVSRGYISLVEKGASKLSDEKIDQLLLSPIRQNWDTRDLVPAYTRLNDALVYISGKLNANTKPGEPLRRYTIKPELEEKIKHGKIGISVALADDIVAHHPELNREWLITGFGEMLNADVPPSDSPSSEIAELKELLIAQKAEMLQMIEVYTERIIKAIRASRE